MTLGRDASGDGADIVFNKTEDQVKRSVVGRHFGSPVWQKMEWQNEYQSAICTVQPVTVTGFHDCEEDR